MNDDILTPIAAKIENLAEAALATKSFYRLSDLGIDLGEDLRTLKLTTSGSLGEFIRKRLNDKFSIILSGEYKNVQALVRTSNVEASPARLVVLEENESEEPKNSPRYNYRFWAAFSVPYRDGRRFVNLKDYTFQDVPAGETPPDGHLEISKELIAPVMVKERDKLIADNISKWIDANKLEKSDFYATRVEKNILATAGLSVLEAMISALDQRQLSNTSLSLDVIAALMRKRV